MVSQAIVGGPPVLLFDEPFADLDGSGVAALKSLVQMWTSRGGTVLSAAPTPAEAPDADAVFLVRGGELQRAQ
jgi:ABC-type protease/lipase transport system fused ATPase/permease subunit